MNQELQEAIELLEETKTEKNWEKMREIDSDLARQFLTYKEKFEGEEFIILLQVGTFYETYFEDAQALSAHTEYALTSREMQKVKVPMCGVPVVNALNAANKLAREGKKVIVVDREKNEGETKLFISRIVTPATITDEEFLSPDEHHYVMSVYSQKDELGIAMVDTLSGEISTRICDSKYAIFDMISRYKPKETRLYITKKWDPELMKRARNAGVTLIELPFYFDENDMKGKIKEHREEHFKGMDVPYTVIAAHSLLMDYLTEVQTTRVTLKPVYFIPERDYLYLHEGAISGLEVLENSQTRKKDASLFGLLDHCKTAKGSRTLKKWIQEPLVNEKEIEKRQQIVEYFMKDEKLRENIQSILSETSDIERIIARLETGKFKENDLALFKNTLERYEELFSLAKEQSTLDALRMVSSKMLEKFSLVVQEVKTKIGEEDVIAKSYHTEFDKVRSGKENGLDQIKAYFEEQKEKYGLKMKLEWNQVYGYFFEVTKSNLVNVPEGAGYEKKKELSSGTCYFVTEKLKSLENEYNEALEKHDSLRKSVLRQISLELEMHFGTIRKVIEFISLLDILMGFAEVAIQYRYKKPAFTESGETWIEGGYHPLLQAFSYKKVVPNTCLLKEGEIQVVTGPNMGGKSTYLKMVGLLYIMAQIGSFVPAKMEFKPIDRLLLRMGANDSMLNNQSTFMVEMQEVGYILYHATKDSLILMDELGRGTSTSDGISLAQATIEHIGAEIGAKSICSTHYHELIDLENERRNVTNYHAEAIETETGVELTYKIKEGGSPKSFGIEVAKRVGLPQSVVERAQELLQTKYAG